MVVPEARECHNFRLLASNYLQASVSVPLPRLQTKKATSSTDRRAKRLQDASRDRDFCLAEPPIYGKHSAAEPGEIASCCDLCSRSVEVLFPWRSCSAPSMNRFVRSCTLAAVTEIVTSWHFQY